MKTNTATTTPRHKLSGEEYASSVKRVGANRFHIASSSKPSSVREVIVRADGSLSCSCPARKKCCHQIAVEDFLAPIELKIAASRLLLEQVLEAKGTKVEPCGCYGCKVVSSLGCYKELNNADAQWAQAI